MSGRKIKKENKKRIFIQRFFNQKFFLFLLKVNLALLSFIFFTSLALEIIISPEAIFENLSKRYISTAKGAFTHLTVNFIGKPDPPVLSIHTSCSNSTAQAFLAWNNVPNTDYYEVYRNNELLMNFLTENTFNDSRITSSNNYSYRVVAKNSSGSSSSNSITITAPNCQPNEPVQPPSTPAEITYPRMIEIFLNGRNINNFTGIPTSKKKKVRFSGIVNIPNAKVTVTTKLRRKKSTVLIANNNGYWTWSSSPSKFKKGKHTIHFSVTDPSNNSRSESVSLRFKIGKLPKKKTATILSSFNNPYLSRASSQPIINMNTSLSSNIFYLGKPITGELTLASYLKNDDELKLKLKIKDKNRTVVAEKALALFSTDFFASPQDQFKKALFRFEESLSRKIIPGKYILETEILNKGESVFSETPIEIKEVPIFSLGNKLNLTYTELESGISLIFIWLIFLMIPIFFFASIEYWLSQRYFPLSEQDLKKNNFIS